MHDLVTSGLQVVDLAVDGGVAVEEVAELPMPPLGDPKRFESAAKRIAENPAAKERFIVGSLPGFTFNIARKIRRLDIYMMDLHLHRDAIETLHNRVDEVLVAMIENYARIGAESIMFAEDWGTQLGLMIRPAMWREIFKPRFEKLCAAARRNGLRVLMHSCGRMTDIIPDLIEVGIDALQFDQQEVHGLDRLAEYAGRVTFWCPVDIQAVLRKGVEADIRAWARALVERLWCGGKGGFIAGFYGDQKSIGVNPEWQAWACDEFVKAGRR